MALEPGFVCFTRPARKRIRKYSIKDLQRIFGYVVEEHGLTEAYCAIATKIGLSSAAREALDAARDIPCVDSDLVGVIPDDLQSEIEDALGTDISDLDTCDEESNISEKLIAMVAPLLILLVVLRKLVRSRVIGFILRRFFLFAIIVSLIEKIEDLVQALIQTAAWVRNVQDMIRVLACQRDSNGDLLKFSDIPALADHVPDSLKGIGL